MEKRLQSISSAQLTGEPDAKRVCGQPREFKLALTSRNPISPWPKNWCRLNETDRWIRSGLEFGARHGIHLFEGSILGQACYRLEILDDVEGVARCLEQMADRVLPTRRLTRRLRRGRNWPHVEHRPDEAARLERRRLHDWRDNEDPQQVTGVLEDVVLQRSRPFCSVAELLSLLVFEYAVCTRRQGKHGRGRRSNHRSEG